MIEVDAAVAILVLVILFGTLFGLVYWARGAAPFDDGTGRDLGELLGGDEGWAPPPPRTPPPWERREPSEPLGHGPEGETSHPDDPDVTRSTEG